MKLNLLTRAPELGIRRAVAKDVALFPSNFAQFTGNTNAD
jgi:hypothetical protein